MPDFAPGIPRSRAKSKLPKFSAKPKDWDFVVHEHKAERAGLHYDLRLSDGNKAFSWAVRKGMPEPGEMRLAIRQPDHRPSYMPFEGRIESGYGKGDVKISDSGPVKVTKSSDDKIQFVVMNKKDADEFTMVRTKGDDWLLMNHTPVRGKVDKKLVTKQKYKNSPANQVASFFSHQWALQPKIDGAHGVTEITPHKSRIFSVRPSKRSDRVLQYTHKIDGADKIKSPVKGRTVVRGEVFGVGPDGKSIPSAMLGGILNSTPENALRRQRTEGVKLYKALFDVEKYDGRDVSKLPYMQKLRILKRIAKKNPDVFMVPETATTSSDKAKLFETIAEGKFPHTQEGVIAHNLIDATSSPVKVKLVEDHDVYVRDVFPGKGKYKGTHAGGFEYSHTPKGEIAGKVGTGFDDELREKMHQDPGKYRGRVARIAAQEKHPGGALRAPSFIGWHLDKNAALSGFFDTLSLSRQLTRNGNG